MDSAGSLESVKACINVVSAIEGRNKALRARIILAWQILLFREFGTIHHIGCLVKKVGFQCVLRVLNLLCISRRELLWVDLLLFNLGHVVLDVWISFSIKLAIFSHQLECLMLVGTHRVL